MSQKLLTRELEPTKQKLIAVFIQKIKRNKGIYEVKYFTYKSRKLFKTESFKDREKKIKHGEFIFYDTLTNNIISKNSFKDNKLDGCQIRYSKDSNYSKIESKIEYKDDMRNGLEEFFFKNGKLISSTTFKNGIKEGISMTFNVDGVKKTEIEYVNNRISVYKGFYDNGIIASIQYFTENEMTGKWLNYHTNGNLRLMRSYKNNVECDTSFSYYENSVLESMLIYKENGDSYYTRFFEDGTIEQIGKYVKLRKDSTWTHYSISGQLKIIENYKNGKLNGEFFQITSFGYEKGFYLNGFRSGKYYGFYPNHQKKYIVTLEEDPQNYFYESFYENGKPHESGRYKSHNRIGKWVIYNSNGKKEVVEYEEEIEKTEVINVDVDSF